MAYKSKNQSVVEEGAPDAAQLESDRKRDLLRRAKIRTEKMIGNRGQVKDGDPSKHYVWVNRSPQRQNDYISLGYRRCQTVVLDAAQADGATAKKLDQVRHNAEIEAKRRGLEGKAYDRYITEAQRDVRPATRWPNTDWEQEDGTHVRGDLILYEIEKEEHEARMLEEEMRGLEFLDQEAAKWPENREARA